MNELATEVRETFGEVAAGVPVPPFDEVAFRRGVRLARVRRRSAFAVVAAAAVGVTAASTYAVVGVVADPELGRDLPPAAGEAGVAPGRLPGPLYFRDPGNLMALTPDGAVHDLGIATDTIVGSTADFVLAQEDTGRLVQVDAASSGEGDGRFTFARGTSPVRGKVGWTVLSEDGRYLASKKDALVSVLDLKADEEVGSYAVAEDAMISAVSERGVLVGSLDGLVLHTPAGEVELPSEIADGTYARGDLAGDLVSVPDRDGVTRVYDVSGRTPSLVEELPGTGRLSAYGRGVVASDVDDGTVRLWRDGRTTELDGVRGPVQEVGWWDEDYALVVSADLSTHGSTVYLCPVAEGSCLPVLASPSGDVSLP